jgi:S1-C subfamily serine protease
MNKYIIDEDFDNGFNDLGEEFGNRPKRGPKNTTKLVFVAFSILSLLALILGALFLLGLLSGNDDDNDALAYSVVQILAGSKGQASCGGSGTVIGDGLHVLTNAHVVTSDESCQIDDIWVATTTNINKKAHPTYSAKIESIDKDLDLAVLSLKPLNQASTSKLVPLSFDSNSPKLGQNIKILGYPGVGGNTITFTDGVVSGFIADKDSRWIKTDALIAHGNSGGAAVNRSGALIGVPTAVKPDCFGSLTEVCDASSDIGLLRPVSEAKNLIKEAGLNWN